MLEIFCNHFFSYVVIMKLYSINAIKSNWKNRGVFRCVSLFCFTYFQTLGITMMTNTRNMFTATMAVLLLFSRGGFLQPRKFTSEANYRTYGCWNNIPQESTIEKIFSIIDNKSLEVKSIFESYLET